MKISLVRTGGIIPLVKKADTEVDWTENEIKELIRLLRADDTTGKMRDNTQYQLVFDNAETISIDPEKVRGKYKLVFEQLKDSLQIVKP